MPDVSVSPPMIPWEVHTQCEGQEYISKQLGTYDEHVPWSYNWPQSPGLAYYEFGDI